ncbi:hypothetical protein [Amycolatopsis sp. NPDC004079]|uniref:hypothetical protein n=1 Tax=Amycolatopsis sp. NPDC004079 TaxID=3154549 RepID=UPI0033BB94EA
MHANDTSTQAAADRAAETGEQQGPAAPPVAPAWTAAVRQNARIGVKAVHRFRITDSEGMFVLFITAVSTAGLLLALWLGIPQYGQAVRLFTDPIAAWLDAHLAGLPVTTPEAAWGWGILGCVLFVAATARHTAARVFWAGYGTATAAVAWDGAADAHRPVAVAAAATVWILLSIPALRPHPRPGLMARLESALLGLEEAVHDIKREDCDTALPAARQTGPR